jgi:hypothetical protein
MRRLDEARAVWLLLAVDAVAIWITYSRLPAAQLYNVTGSGFAGGASRVLVATNYPYALIAIAIVLTLFGRVDRRLAILAIALCAVVAWPGVVRQSNLDARWVNLVPAVGVALALVLTIAAGPARPRPFGGSDWLRIAIAAVLTILAVPWIAAEAGFYLPDNVYLTGALRPEPGTSHLVPAVHHGHHHGLGGLLLVYAALLLSRCRVGVIACLWFGLMVVYGVALIANDAWDEQVVKRGWATSQIPVSIVPELSVAWAVILVLGLALGAGRAAAGERR